MKSTFLLSFFLLVTYSLSFGQSAEDSILTLDRIFNSNEFQPAFISPIQWIDDGDSYVSIEYDEEGTNEIIKYDSRTGRKSTLLSSENVLVNDIPLRIENFSFSDDESKILLFSNSSRVWRANTKGDYWVYDRSSKNLTQLGKNFTPSSLMFAKFSSDNNYLAYVQNFNVYVEDFNSGEVVALTQDGTGDIINGTFDWVYEEEFGCRDGFRWSPDGKHVAYWQLDASSIGTHYMINNTDSIYSVPIPLQYPKVGDDPSSCKVGVVSKNGGKTVWIPVPGDDVQNYIPGLQWISDDELMIQQLNRKQNHLKIWKYNIGSNAIELIYEEKEDTWVDIYYPDPSASGWSANDLTMIDDGDSFLRMTEDEWRTIYKINTQNSKKTKISSGSYDVASIKGQSKNDVYFMASPENTTQRFLYRVGNKGGKRAQKVTPRSFKGMNNYNISPNGKYAIHRHSSALRPNKIEFITLPDHRTLRVMEDNKQLNSRISQLSLPQVEFFTVPISDGYETSGRMILPPDFDDSKKYPVIFHVYGEPWGSVAQDSWIGMWNIFLAQKGYIIVDMDNRGTPCLKGSEWRKSIYRKIGVLNSDDQADAAREVLKWEFIDPSRTAVWGWSGGGSMTLNQMFRYPEIYKTGISVAPVSNQLVYDNIYQERYMGLPQENKEDFINGSPITYAKNLTGNLLLIHGTADDNVHYQSAELLINELIKNNKQFDMMSYPNRSHGIWEGDNTTRHLYSKMTKYFLEHVPINAEYQKMNRP